MRLLKSFWFAPIVAGVAMYLCYAPPDVGWLMPFAWALLFLSVRLRSGARSGMQLFVAGLVLFGPGIWWLTPLAWPLWVIVVLWCAGWESLFGRFIGKVFAREGGPPAAWVVIVPLAHLLFDMVRTVLFSGFSWMLPGYAGWKNPVLLGSADLIGVHGATLATLVLAACLAECAARALTGQARVARAFVPAALLWGALAAWAFVKPKIETTPGPTVLVLQPSIPQQWKEDLDKSGKAAPTAESMWTLQEKLAADAPKVDLVIWAETMTPADADRPLVAGEPLLTWVKRGETWVRSDADGLRLAAAARGAWTLAGMRSVQVGKDAVLDFNTVVLLDDKAIVKGFQDKQHLTPGGEYIPLKFLIPFRKSFEEYLRSAVGFLPDLQAGDGAHVLPLSADARIGVMICYEFLFPQVPLEHVQGGATMLVDASNFGWFSKTSFMAQALGVCAFRAAELRRSVVVASNNGISTVFGPDGRLLCAPTPADEPAALVSAVPLCASRSPFSVVGEWAAWALGAAGFAACLVVAKRGFRAP